MPDPTTNLLEESTEGDKILQPATKPTQKGPEGILYDYNAGVRIYLPCVATWTLNAWDDETGTVLAQRQLHDADAEESGEYYTVVSSKKYFMPIAFEVLKDGVKVFENKYNCTQKEVFMWLPKGTLGDIIAWMSAVVEFEAVHKCYLTVRMEDVIIELFRDAYPHITFVDQNTFIDCEKFYASYYIGLFMQDTPRNYIPFDYKSLSLIDVARHSLGLGRCNGNPTPPLVVAPDLGRPIPEKYVCIAVQATCAAKLWMNPYGWAQVVGQLKKDGYRVICIDKTIASGDHINWHFMPPGAEDETGARPLVERANWLRYCEFFIGLSSGLSWLAWAMGTTVVLVSGFTSPYTEFYTPYRVINHHACNSCWNRHLFDNGDYLWCPDHKGTKRHFECTQSITAHHVMNACRSIPFYGS